jgi:hypothetical protein
MVFGQALDNIYKPHQYDGSISNGCSNYLFKTWCRDYVGHRGAQRSYILGDFCGPKRGGFGGRQSFSKGSDHFYSAVQAAVTNAAAYVSWYDTAKRQRGAMPDACVIAFPIVVIEGALFEAHFDQTINDVSLHQVNQVRCHWKGSADWGLIATVDIVSLDHLDEFVKKRRAELKTLIDIMKPAFVEIEEFRKSGSLTAISLTEGPRGYRALPALLKEFSAVNAKRHNSKSE